MDRDRGEGRLALHFEVDETVPDGVRRILDETLQTMATDLGDAAVEDDRAVHETRRNCKRIRAILRMVRDELGPRWSLEDHWYRDLARSLSSARDAVVSLAALGRVEEQYERQVDRRTLKSLRKALRKRSAHTTKGIAALREEAAEEIEGARARTRGLPLRSPGFGALAPGLAATYGRARLILHRAAEAGQAEDFHHLRKRAKNLFYQVGTLRESHPERIGALEAQFDRLAEILGDAQDLHVLRNALGDTARQPEADAVVGLAGRWESELHDEILTLGEEVLSRPDTEFVGELEGYWTAWKDERRQ